MSVSTTIVLPTGQKVTIPTGLFINNEFVPAKGGETFETINPSTEEVICSVSSAQASDVDLAVQAAREAFRTTWGKNTPGVERGKLLYKLADLIERDAQILAELEAIDNGKPVKIAREFDIGDSVACLRYYAGWADKIHGQTIETNDLQKMAYTKHEPIGVCGQIIPWNYPIQMWAWKVSPALACGCTIVMKPSELTPLTALKLCELVVEAGFPPGVLNCTPGIGSVTGHALSSHHDVDKVAFTGSTITGRKIMEAAAKSNLKKVTLELGGKSPNLVFESADLDQAANWCLLGITYNMGQDCTAGSRVYVQESIYDKFIQLLVKKFAQVKVGNPYDEKTFNGPLVSKGQFEKVLGFIEEGKKSGAKVVAGGGREGTKGYFVKPTIFADVHPYMRIVKEEIFGPVLALGRFKTEEEAIALANATTYGLGAGLHSNDAKQCMRVSNALEAGTVWVNQYNLLNNNVPFGGYKQSGIGRELGEYALANYTNVKAVHFNFGEELEWPPV